MTLLAQAPTQEEQIEYARSLRMLKTGWTPELRQTYFSWFLKAASYKGGHELRPVPAEHEERRASPRSPTPRKWP